MNIDKALNPPEKPAKANSRFRIGQVVEAIAELMSNPPTNATELVTGRIKAIAPHDYTYWYLIKDINGGVWSAAEDDIRRPREVPNGWEPKESK